MENNITKLFAIILDRKFVNDKETGGNCKVFILEENSIKNKNQDYIKKVFPENGNIFSSLIFFGANSNQLQIGDFIEIPIDEIFPKTDDSQSTYIKHQPIKKIGLKVIDIPINIISQGFLDIEKINDFFDLNFPDKERIGKFYLFDSQYLYGPFKIEKTSVIPVVGKSVYQYHFNIDELIDIDYYNYSYILEEPKKRIAEIDCMSKIQILEHLKESLKSFQNINLEINSIRELKKAVIKNNSGSESLNALRLSRAHQYLDELELSYDELNKLKANNQTWESIFNSNYNKHKKDFEKDFVRDAENSKKTKEKELESLKKEILDCEKKLILKKKNIEEVLEEIDQINTKKEDLILSIKIAAAINDNVAGKNELSKSYYEIISSNISSSITDLDEFYDQFDINITSKQLFKKALYILKEKKFLIGNSIELILNTIQHLGCYEIMIQNAEADWLKFKYLEENGFSKICQMAYTTPEVPHFFILQDFNVASFECYGKPILDIANGVRNKIPGTENDWPNNLFFILITLESEINDFGFPLNKSTFKKWTFLPYTLGYSLQKIKITQGLSLSELEAYDNYENDSESYFI